MAFLLGLPLALDEGFDAGPAAHRRQRQHDIECGSGVFYRFEMHRASGLFQDGACDMQAQAVALRDSLGYIISPEKLCEYFCARRFGYAVAGVGNAYENFIALAPNFDVYAAALGGVFDRV